MSVLFFPFSFATLHKCLIMFTVFGDGNGNSASRTNSIAEVWNHSFQNTVLYILFFEDNSNFEWTCRMN
jgi:hypothetical protein